MFAVGDNVHYYAVDHSPSHLWNSATWEISEALLPYLRPVLTGPKAWAADETIQRAVGIRDGVIQNPRILSFRRRSPRVPAPPSGRQRHNTVIFREIADRHGTGPRIARTVSGGSVRQYL